MTSQFPKITILLPVYNAGQYLNECIDSLLRQTFEDFELLIINDGSKDNTVEICESYQDPRIRLVHNSDNRGITYTLNRGIELARADLIARMDADDIAMENRLAVQVAYMESHPEVGAVSSDMIRINPEGKPIAPGPAVPAENGYITWAMMFRNPIVHPAVMFRRSLVKAINGYGYEESYVEDYDLWSRLYRKYPICVLADKLIRYRIHPDSISNKHAFRQAIAAAKIAQENMTLYLDEPVEEVSARLLFYAYHGYLTSYSSREILKAAELLDKLYHCFLDTQSWTDSLRSIIRTEAQKMVINLALSLPFKERLQLLAKPFPYELMSLRLLLNIVYNWKPLARQVLRRRPVIPIAPPAQEKSSKRIQQPETACV